MLSTPLARQRAQTALSANAPQQTFFQLVVIAQQQVTCDAASLVACLLMSVRSYKADEDTA